MTLLVTFSCIFYDLELQLGMTLTDYRKQAGLTLQQVAERMGVSHVAVVKMEKAGNPKLSTLRRYVDAVGVAPEELVKNLTDSIILS